MSIENANKLLNVLQFILVANVYRNHVISSKSRIFYGFDDGTGRISGYKMETGTGYPMFMYAIDDYWSIYHLLDRL